LAYFYDYYFTIGKYNPDRIQKFNRKVRKTVLYRKTNEVSVEMFSLDVARDSLSMM